MKIEIISKNQSYCIECQLTFDPQHDIHTNEECCELRTEQIMLLKNLEKGTAIELGVKKKTYIMLHLKKEKFKNGF